MKNTQKKLKAKHFRYLTKEIINNPMDYLEEFFAQYISCDGWYKQIKLMVISSCYPKMLSRKNYMDGSFYCKMLIKQVEVAYVIYTQCGIERKKKKVISLLKSQTDYYNYKSDRFTYKGEENPCHELCLFFSYMSLAEWYKTLDDFWIYMTMDDNEYDDRFGDRIIIIQELLLRLAYALHNIYMDCGIELTIPAYCYVDRNEEDKSKE